MCQANHTAWCHKQLAEGALNASFTSPTKLLNSANPHTDPWGTAHITDPHLDTEPLTSAIGVCPSGRVRSNSEFLHTPERRVAHCCHPSPFLGYGGYMGRWWGCLVQLQHLLWCDGSFLLSLQSIDVILHSCLRHQEKSLPPSVPCRCMFPVSCIIAPSALLPSPSLAVCSDPRWSCTLREVPTILPWGSETVSDLDPSIWSWNGFWFLDYGDFESQHLVSWMSLFWRGAISAVMNCLEW